MEIPIVFGRFTGAASILLLCFAGTGYAEETFVFSKGFNFTIPDTEITLQWLDSEKREYYPNKEEYELNVDNLLNSSPMCLDTEIYCRITRMKEYGLDGHFVLKKTEILPSTIQRPHEDPRVVEHWERQETIHGGLEIINGLVTGGSLGGTLEVFGADNNSHGGHY